MFPNEGMLNVLQTLIDFTTPKMRLVQALPSGVTDANMTRADLIATGIEADYPGYAGQVVTWGAPAIVAGPDGKVISTTLTFQPTGMSTPQTIHGYWLETSSGFVTPRLLMWHRLTTPIVLASDASQFQRVLNWYDANFNP